MAAAAITASAYLPCRAVRALMGLSSSSSRAGGPAPEAGPRLPLSRAAAGA
jgi:hypothetical protein